MRGCKGLKSPKLISTAVLVIFILASMTPLALAAFSVSTDRAYYKPGDSVIISITGATPNDVVTLQINSTPTNILWVYEVTTDSSGSAKVTVVASWDWLAGKPDENLTVYAKDQGTQTPALTTFVIDAQRPAVFIAYPLPGSYINNPCPTMVATYSDNIGVDVNRVFLFLDSVNVTAQAQQIDATHAVYTPSADLPEGVHNFTVVVFDLAGNMNSTLSIFTTDYTSPKFYNFTPANNTFTANPQPLIAVNFTDNAPLNLASAKLFLNGTDVTADAKIYAGGLEYTPPTSLSDGVWNACVYIEDVAGNSNSTWWLFIVDTTPPLASNFKPANGSTISNTRPWIAANYTDLHGINTSAVKLFLNGKDVTSKATIKPTYIAYKPATDLAKKKHRVILYVEDVAGNGKNFTWSFTIKAAAPPLPPPLPQPHRGAGAQLPTQRHPLAPRLAHEFAGQGHRPEHAPAHPLSFHGPAAASALPPPAPRGAHGLLSGKPLRGAEPGRRLESRAGRGRASHPGGDQPLGLRRRSLPCPRTRRGAGGGCHLRGQVRPGQGVAQPVGRRGDPLGGDSRPAASRGRAGKRSRGR